MSDKLKEMKMFLDIHRLKELITNRPALPNILKLFKQKENDNRRKLQPIRINEEYWRESVTLGEAKIF